jgi:hypothetical protein
LEPGAKPKHIRPYPVPVIHLETFKKELMHLCGIKVLQPPGASEWASPTSVNTIFDLAKLIFVEKFLVDLAIY